MCFAAGLTELETEVHPRPGMQSRGWIYPQCLSLCLAATRGASGAASACSALASSLLNLPVAREGLVPGEPRTRHLGEQHWVQQFILHRCWPETMGGFMHVIRLHYPAVFFFFFVLFFTTPPPPPWAASWWQGVSAVSQCEGAGLYSAFSWQSCAPLGTSNRALSHGFAVLVSASAPFLPVAWGLQLSSHLFIWPSFVLVSLALIWFPLAQDLNVSQYLICLSSHMQTHTHTCEVRKYHQSCCTDRECSVVIG